MVFLNCLRLQKSQCGDLKHLDCFYKSNRLSFVCLILIMKEIIAQIQIQRAYDYFLVNSKLQIQRILRKFEQNNISIFQVASLKFSIQNVKKLNRFLWDKS
eukprot:TRINITY_DN10880_c0_g1_i1.p4 TRINITY_DN10880_c0_g1~~TRINITY_DN10880_c0_g1_i1.p4  ORF type:complete len:101 (-),score=0.75 TRINITY_DN10880_c0_g1_i1:183-485(-)